MVTKEYMHIEMITPVSWSHGIEKGEVVAEFEDVCDGTDNLILSIPLHEDFFDFCKSYCDQYREYIQNKIK